MTPPPIRFINKQRSILPFSVQNLNSFTHSLLCLGGHPPNKWDFSVSLLTRPKMRAINQRFRAKDEPTDILSFPFENSDWIQEEILGLGDIYICPQVVAHKLKKGYYSHKEEQFEERIKKLIIHGYSHCLGYDHIKDDDFIIMQKFEDNLWEKIQNEI